MRRYIIAAAIAVPVLTILTIVGVYAYDEIATDDRVSHGVTSVGIDLSRMTGAEATAAITGYETALASKRLEVVVDGQTLTISPTEIGFDVDETSVVSEAKKTRRSPNGFSNFSKWISTRFGSVDIPVAPTIDESAVLALLSDWDLSAIDKPAYDGAVLVVNGSPAPEYPLAGTRIDHEASLPLILAGVSGDIDGPIVLPLLDIVPSITDADVDAAVADAVSLISEPISLRPARQVHSMVFSPAGLTSALRSEIVTQSPSKLVTYLDDDVITAIASSLASSFEVEPEPATFLFDDETKQISVVPSTIGRTVDLDAVAEAVNEAVHGTGNGLLPMKEGREADLSTEKALAMGPFGEVSTFTTRHDCCANRVVNIQLLADTIGGSWVFLGETFSINDTAGKRTEANGYKRAGAIIGGIITCCDSPVNVGGGTSQFATTFYNAVFFGCYEDVFHQPHSIYFSRYPFVREATLGFPSPDVKFKNDSESVVYIETSYTPTSITVTLHGNNGGRTCESVRSGNTITRVMTHPDGSVTNQDWSWNYRLAKTTTTTTTSTVPPTTSSTTTTTSTTSTTTTTTTTMPPTTTTTTAAP
ncbi:MAG: VanW family protein [Actinomycetota bacterium]|nr:VanW family protein [Actinomycetota bacterium]